MALGLRDRIWDLPTGTLQIVLGTDDLTATSHEKIFEVAEVVLNEAFSGNPTKGGDIALIKLRRPWTGATVSLTPSADAEPRGLDSDDPSPRSLGLVTGFGTTPATSQSNTVKRFIDGEGPDFYDLRLAPSRGRLAFCEAGEMYGALSPRLWLKPSLYRL